MSHQGQPERELRRCAEGSSMPRRKEVDEDYESVVAVKQPAPKKRQACFMFPPIDKAIGQEKIRNADGSGKHAVLAFPNVVSAQLPRSVAARRM